MNKKEFTVRNDIPKHTLRNFNLAENIHTMDEITIFLNTLADIANDKPKENSKSDIKDSGSRRKFDSGAVRDVQEGKGRCDLLPLFDIGTNMNDSVILNIGLYRETGDVNNLFKAIQECNKKAGHPEYVSLLYLAKHYEKGTAKYGERNWEKGIPVHCFIDSGVRHYLKWRCGWKDEPHKDAFLWNMWGAIWTIRNKPELDDYKINKKDR